MVKDWAFYTSDGRIYMVGRMTVEEALLTVEVTTDVELSLAEGKANYFTDYVLDGAITARPQNTAYLEDLVLVDVPVPSVVSIDGVRYECDESTIELGFTVPGRYIVEVTSWPYLDTKFEIIHED